MKGPSKLYITTSLIGISLSYISMVNGVLFSKNGEIVFYVIGVIFALLLPAVITDPRKNLRSNICCAGWWGLSILFLISYLQIAPIIAITCLIMTLFVGLLFVSTHCVILGWINNSRSNQDMVHIKTKRMLIVFYYISALFVFTALWAIKRSSFAIVVPAICLCTVMVTYLVYYWRWGILLQKNNRDFWIFRKGAFTAHSINDIREIRHIPMLGYFALDVRKHILFRFSLSMENSAAFWLAVRCKSTK